MTLWMLLMTERHHTLLFRLPFYFFPTFLLLAGEISHSNRSRLIHSHVWCTSLWGSKTTLASMAGAAKGNKMGGGGANKWSWTHEPDASRRYLVAVVCGIIDPLPDVSLVFHGDGSYSGFGGRSRGHAELHVHVVGKSGRHFPVRAKFKVAEETVWVTRSYERKRI